MHVNVCCRVIDGWDVLDSLEAQPVKEKYRPLNDIHIKDVTIHANPIADGLITKTAV
jgi:peptidyl-prolyl cis-trans isomerase-like 3